MAHLWYDKERYYKKDDNYGLSNQKDPISKIPKVQLAFWLLVRLAMLICAGYSFIHGDTVMGFESIFCFIFTHLWDLFQIFGNGSFIEEVPPLSQTLLNIIIFIGIVFGFLPGAV